MTSQSKSLSRSVGELTSREELDVPFSEGFCQEPDDDRKVLAFVVGWKYNGVFMRIHSWVGALYVQRWRGSERVHDFTRQHSHDHN